MPTKTRRRFRPGAERLDERLLLTMVTFTRATASDYRTIVLDYTVEPGTFLTDLPVAIWRSADPVLDNSDVRIGSADLTASQLTPGVHTKVPLTLGLREPGVDALAPDPAHPFVLVTADLRDGTTTAGFRKYLVGLISHGFEPPTVNDQLPAWETQMAASLTAAGYDVVIPFNWMATAGTPAPGLAVAAGTRAGEQLIQAIAANVPADGVVDPHWIGHSRGSVVITQAAHLVQANLALVPQAAGGYWRLTYLDPHPAHAVNVVPFSAANNRLGRLALALGNAFQQVAQDPFPLVVPSMVIDVQTYYQNSPASTLLPLTAESVLNPWGTSPPEGIMPSTGAPTRFETLNLTTPGMAHSVVHDWYQQNVVPTLNTASPFVNGPVATPILATGENIYAIEDIPLPHLAASFTDSNPQATASSFTATIDWGDGTPATTGTILGSPLLGYAVFGTHQYDASGSFVTTITIRSVTGAQTTVMGTATVKGFATTVADVPPGNAPLVVGTRSDTGARLFSILAYEPGFAGGVSVATADVNGDGTPDIVTAPGAGTAGIVKVFDGTNQQLIRQVAPFGTRYRRGLQVAAGDVDADGKAELIVGAGRWIRVLRADGSVLFQTTSRGLPLSGPDAVRLVAADIDADGRADLSVTRDEQTVRTIVTGRAIAEANLARRARLLRTGSIRQLVASSPFAGSLPLIRQLLRLSGRR